MKKRRRFEGSDSKEHYDGEDNILWNKLRFIGTVHSVSFMLSV